MLRLSKQIMKSSEYLNEGKYVQGDDSINSAHFCLTAYVREWSILRMPLLLILYLVFPLNK